MRRYDEQGVLLGARRVEDEIRAARLAERDAERARNSAAFARLCGMAAPIGGPSRG